MAVKGTECRRAEKRSGGANLKVFQETPLVRKLMKTPAQSEPTTKSHRWRAWCGVESLQNQKKKSEQSDFLTKLYPFFTSTNSFCYFEKVRLGRHTRLISATFSLGIFWFLPSQLESWPAVPAGGRLSPFQKMSVAEVIVSLGPVFND